MNATPICIDLVILLVNGIITSFEVSREGYSMKLRRERNSCRLKVDVDQIFT